ncbi:MAG: cytochrome c [Alphaproteobacteria bacterium]|nr:cytochrome c [Alphaproteobacteria bacterium]
MTGLFRVGSYSVGLIGLFTAFSYYGIPQLVPEPPPTEERMTDAMTTGEFVAAGARLYARACVLCHSGVGDRAPRLDAIATVWRERIGDARYRGSAKNLEEYLRESMLEPSAYVVQGFGKPGTGDGESPMPAATTGALALNPGEIDAVIAHLQSAAGAEVTVAPRAGLAAGAGRPQTEAFAGEKAPDAVAALQKFQCSACHLLPGLAVEEGAQLPGPDLREIWKTAANRVAGVNARDFLAESILFPNKVVAKDFEPGLMPEDYGDRMLVAELQMIVDYLTQER